MLSWISFSHTTLPMVTNTKHSGVFLTLSSGVSPYYILSLLWESFVGNKLIHFLQSFKNNSDYNFFLKRCQNATKNSSGCLRGKAEVLLYLFLHWTIVQDTMHWPSHSFIQVLGLKKRCVKEFWGVKVAFSFTIPETIFWPSKGTCS